MSDPTKLPPGFKFAIPQVNQTPVTTRVSTPSSPSGSSNVGQSPAPVGSGAKPNYGEYNKYKKGTGNTLSFYKLHTTDSSGAKPSFRITKFDQDLNVESSYLMNYIPGQNGGYYDCLCPASKFDCRHKAIMAEIVSNKKQDSDYFFCFEAKTFKKAEEIG